MRIHSNICTNKDIFLKENFREVSFFVMVNHQRMEEESMSSTALGAEKAIIYTERSGKQSVQE